MLYEFNNIRISKADSSLFKSDKYKGCISVSVPHNLSVSIRNKINKSYYKEANESSSSRSMNIYAHTYATAPTKINKTKHTQHSSFSLSRW